MNIEIKIEDNKVYLYYFPNNGIDWIKERINEYRIKYVFKVIKKFTSFEAEKVKVELAELNGEYFKFHSSVFDINFDFYFHKDIELKLNFFELEKISIFKMIEKININQDSFYIGGKKENAIPESIFRELVSKFPNNYETQKYRLGRVDLILNEYLTKEENFFDKYQKYIKKKNKRKLDRYILSGINKVDDLKKFIFLRDTLKNSLNTKNNEFFWQKLILEIIKILYPKYILILENLEVSDPYYDKTGKAKTNKRFIDLALLDVEGNLDIIEIKVPEVKIISDKINYRNNFYPTKDLSGSLVQVEKYLFYLNKGGIKLEKSIKQRYENKLPKDFPINITNPTGMIIAGRSFNWIDRKKKDFEIIKRKNKNITDIITYDNILMRLENFITILQKK